MNHDREGVYCHLLHSLLLGEILLISAETFLYNLLPPESSACSASLRREAHRIVSSFLGYSATKIWRRAQGNTTTRRLSSLATQWKVSSAFRPRTASLRDASNCLATENGNRRLWILINTNKPFLPFQHANPSYGSRYMNFVLTDDCLLQPLGLRSKPGSVVPPTIASLRQQRICPHHPFPQLP